MCKRIIGFALCCFLSSSASTHGLKLQELNQCRLGTMLPFTDLRDPVPASHADKGVVYYGYGSWPNATALAKASYSYLATSELAKLHFNTRYTGIVPELGELGDCNITLTNWYFDTGYLRNKTSYAMIHSFLELSQAFGMEFAMNSICGVIGPVGRGSHEGMSVLTEGADIPQIAFATISQRLERSESYPTFVRTNAVAYDFAATIAYYIQRDILKRDYFAVIYDQSDFGEEMEHELEQLEEELGYETITEHFIEGDDESLEEAFEVVARKGYRTIVLITDRQAMLDDVARVADEYGLLGEGYLWVLMGNALPPAIFSDVKYPVDSPTDRLLRGAALISNYDRFVYLEEQGQGDTDPFLREWRKQDKDLVQVVNTAVPTDEKGKKYYTASDSYFQTEQPTEYSSFLYDAVMAAGIGACRAQQFDTGLASKLAGMSHRDAILRSQFTGASGHVQFKEGTSSRDVGDVVFGMHNIRPGPIDAIGMRRYEKVLTSLYSRNNSVTNEENVIQGSWKNVGPDFLYFDGTPVEPMPKRTVFDAHYINRHIRIAGLFMTTFAIVSIIATGLWVFLYRKDRAIIASQPIFLYLLCAGAVLCAASFYFIAFDEETGLNAQQLSSMCSAFPWFFVVGYLTMYCALFSKLWRLDKLLEMRRRVVKMEQVMLPFALIITTSILVLVVWQVVDPLVWKREIISRDPLETYGTCNSIEAIPFIVALAILCAVVVVMTAVIAWKLIDVQSDLSESKWIFYGIFTHITLWSISIPIIVITTGVSKEAWYLMYTALGFSLPVSLVEFVIFPKIFAWFLQKYFKGKSKRGNVHINVSDTGSKTRISGLPPVPGPASPNLTINNCSGFSNDAKVTELENEVNRLRSELSKRSNLSIEMPTNKSGSEERLP